MLPLRQVRLIDQQQINEFGRINTRKHELAGDIKDLEVCAWLAQHGAALLSGRRWFFESPPPSVSSGNRLPRGCLLPSESLRHARRL